MTVHIPCPQQSCAYGFIGPACPNLLRAACYHTSASEPVAHFFAKKKVEGLDTDKMAFYILQNVKYVTPVGRVDDGPVMDEARVGIGSRQSGRPERERGSGRTERRQIVWSGSGNVMAYLDRRDSSSSGVRLSVYVWPGYPCPGLQGASPSPASHLTKPGCAVPVTSSARPDAVPRRRVSS